MELKAFGYAALKTSNLEDWADFGPRFLGLQLVERTRSAIAFRMDDRKQRIVVSAEDDFAQVFGWEVDDAASLDSLAGRLEAAHVSVSRMTASACAMRGVTAGLCFADPLGNRLEAFHGAAVDARPFTPGRPISGFRTGPLGMGHVVLNVANFEDAQWF